MEIYRNHIENHGKFRLDGRSPVSAAEVVGDRLLSGDDVAVVVDVDPDTMQITFNGGERMGMRVILGDATLYINQVESAPVSDPEEGNPFDLDAVGTGQIANKGVESVTPAQNQPSPQNPKAQFHGDVILSPRAFAERERQRRANLPTATYEQALKQFAASKRQTSKRLI